MVFHSKISGIPIKYIFLRSFINTNLIFLFNFDEKSKLQALKQSYVPININHGYLKKLEQQFNVVNVSKHLLRGRVN